MMTYVITISIWDKCSKNVPECVTYVIWPKLNLMPQTETRYEAEEYVGTFWKCVAGDWGLFLFGSPYKFEGS